MSPTDFLEPIAPPFFEFRVSCGLLFNYSSGNILSRCCSNDNFRLAGDSGHNVIDKLFGFESTAALRNQPAETSAEEAGKFAPEDDITVLTIARALQQA
jgi:hypothetical protein